MASNSITKTLYVENMTCVNCENRIERVLSETAGVDNVSASYSKGTVIVSFDSDVISLESICKILEDEDYHAHTEEQSKHPMKMGNTGHKAAGQVESNASNRKDRKPKPAEGGIYDLAGILIIFFALYIIADRLGLLNIIYSFPVAKDGMGYGMLFVIGLLTSVHCVAMCGGICLSQCVPQKEESPVGKFAALRPSLLYNTGRVISYTIIGGIVGAIGSVVSFSGFMKGIVQILAGVFMMIMGLNMLNIFPWLRKLQPRMPKSFAKMINSRRKSNSPFYIGILNGLMPCGPLQAMQIYALSTGSPIKGAISMFLFSIGTVPLMFAFGVLSSFLSKKFTVKMMKVSGVLVILLGVFMFNNGTSLSGVALPTVPSTIQTGTEAKPGIATIRENVQVVTSGLTTRSYEPITVQKGIPVRWTITAEPGEISGCNNAIIIPQYNITKSLEIGDNVIEFTPTESGAIAFSCWMGMIRSKITVVDDLNKNDNQTINEGENVPGENGPAGDIPAAGGGCCAGDSYGSGSDASGSVSEDPEDYSNLLLPKIPTDEVAVAEIKDNKTQLVEIDYDENGLSPAVIVVQEGIMTGWNIKAGNVDSSKSDLIFPYYNAKLSVKPGDNTIGFTPDQDFYFFSSDGAYAGYVKVVDDITKMDPDMIKQEVSEFQQSSNGQEID